MDESLDDTVFSVFLVVLCRNFADVFFVPEQKLCLSISDLFVFFFVIRIASFIGNDAHLCNSVRK